MISVHARRLSQETQLSWEFALASFQFISSALLLVLHLDEFFTTKVAGYLKEQHYCDNTSLAEDMGCGSYTMDREELDLVQNQACNSMCSGCVGVAGVVRDTKG